MPMSRRRPGDPAYRSDSNASAASTSGRVLGIVRRLRKLAEAHRNPKSVHALVGDLGKERVFVVLDRLQKFVAVVRRTLYRRRRASRHAVRFSIGREMFGERVHSHPATHSPLNARQTLAEQEDGLNQSTWRPKYSRLSPAGIVKPRDSRDFVVLAWLLLPEGRRNKAKKGTTP